jgi:hypothetical protein
MTDGHKELGKKYVSDLYNMVRNLPERVKPNGDLRDQALTGIYAACMITKEGHGGISMDDAKIILDEWIGDMTQPSKPSWGY